MEGARWPRMLAVGSCSFIHGMTRATPNDPKLSDGGGWRGPCMAGGKAAAEARAVTAGAVRCSAWLGVAVICEISRPIALLDTLLF